MRKFVKKGFTVLEVLLAISILSLFTMFAIFTFSDYRDRIFDVEKEMAAQRIAFNYMEGIDNIRTSVWIDANINPNNVGWTLNLTECWTAIRDLKTVSMTTDLLGWFCKKLPWPTGGTFSELNGYYTLNFKRDPITNESKNELISLGTPRPWNAENFDSYTVFYKINKNIVGGKKNDLIDYTNENLMKKRFEGTNLDPEKYITYFNNDKPIPWRVMLVTIQIEDGKDADLEGFTDEEKTDYYRSQIKHITVKVEWGNKDWERKEYVLKRTLTNFKWSL